jgi:hypothetical protein
MSVLSDLAAGATSGLFSSIGSMAVNIRTAIKGVELDPNKAADIEAQLAGIEQQARALDVQFAQITEQDRDSARKRETDIAKAGKKNITMPILAVIAIGGMFGLSYFALTHDIRERELAFMIVGFAIAITKDIYGFYFGSSAGSNDKNDIISSMAEKK